MSNFNRIDPKCGWVHPQDLPKGPNGRALCRRCHTEVPKGLRTFCGKDCIHEWKIRTQPAYARNLVERRDRGVCAACGLDTKALRQAYEACRPTSRWNALQGRHEYVASTVLPLTDHELASARKLRNKFYSDPKMAQHYVLVVRALLLGFSPDRSWWQADHIVPVAEGGGSCGLENYRTLCSPCHAVETGKLRRRLNARRKAQSSSQSP